MSMCPLCNQFSAAQSRCPNCSHIMNDQGRVMDYFDDYSPYLEIDGMKQADGYSEDFQNDKCPHLLNCSFCGEDQVLLVDEWLNKHNTSWG
jgi:hypothetical protein